MKDSISSKNKAGTLFTTKLEYAFVVDKTTVLPAGTLMYGVVKSSSQARRVRGQSTLDLRLTKAILGGAPVPMETVARIVDAWSQYLVLVFPGQALSDQQHVEMTRYFGEPEIFHQDIIKSERVREIFRVANTDEDGNLIQPDHPTLQQLGIARRWHTDSSYRPKPAIGSLLHGIKVTEEGGVTCLLMTSLCLRMLSYGCRRGALGRMPS